MNLRLNTLAEMVDPQARVADIGTDHAYLPIQLIKSQKITFAIASDIGKGPLANAQQDIMEAGFENKIETRLGPGLATIKPSDKIDTVVIAGMGGKLITQILDDAYKQGQIYTTLILEPNIGESGVRTWLAAHNYEIAREELLFEAGHTYELIKAKLSSQPHSLTERELFFGPKILEQKNQVFYQKWHGQKQYFEKLLGNLQKAKQPDSERIKQVKHDLQLIEEELQDDPS